MKLPNPYACDICKQTKKDSNNWFKGQLRGGGIGIVPWRESNDSDTAEEVADLCGEACVHEWISRNLSKIY